MPRPPHQPASPAGFIRAIPNRDKQAQDTSGGCFTLAAADLLRAGDMDTGHGREKYAASAAAWTCRAELLKRIETGSARRAEMPACC